MMDSFSPSQSFQQPMQPIFFDSSRSPLNIFADASLLNRPRLVRRARGAGATICSDPATAQIILVDSTTDPGRQFIRDWGKDADKVVLDAEWVWKSIEAGEALLFKQGWGGMLAQDDGQPINKNGRREDDDDDIDKSPLPTPRPTPAGAGPSSLRRSTSKRKSRSSSSISSIPLCQKVYPEQALPPTPQPQVNIAPQLHQPIPNVPMSMSPFPSQSMQQIISPSLMSNTFLPQIPHSQPLALSHPGTPFGQFNGTQAYPWNMMFTLIETMQRNGVNPMTMVNAQNQGLMAQMNQQLNMASMSQPILTQPQHYSNMPSTSMLVTQKHDDNLELLDIENENEAASSDGSSSFRLSRDASMERRDSTPPPPSTNIASKNKGKAKMRMHSPTDDEPDMYSFSSHSARYSTPPASSPMHPSLISQTLKTGIPRPPGEIFKSDSNSPFSFFVQVDIKRRHDVVQAIKKNGGKITPIISVANYVILSNNRSTAFASLYEETISVHKHPLRLEYIHDCVTECKLLDIERYVVDGSPSPTKRGRPTHHKVAKGKKTSHKRKSEVDNETFFSTGPERKKVKKQDSTVAPTDSAGLRSPTPPSIDDAVTTRGNFHSFTEKEVAYTRRYCRFMIERELTISKLMIAKMLYMKMPWHPLGSWKSYIKREFVEPIRKDVEMVLHNKKRDDALAVVLTEPSAIKSEPSLNPLELPITVMTNVPEYTPDAQEEGVSPVSDPKPDESAPASPAPSDPVAAATSDPGPVSTVDPTSSTDAVGSSVVTDEADDFDTICNFFANGWGDDPDDEAVWAALTLHRPCKTAATWPLYYTERMSAINARIEELASQGERSSDGETEELNIDANAHGEAPSQSLLDSASAVESSTTTVTATDIYIDDKNESADTSAIMVAQPEEDVDVKPQIKMEEMKLEPKIEA